MNITPPSTPRKPNTAGKVTRPFIADSITRFSADDQSISKQLSARLAQRYQDELRFLSKLGLWVHCDPLLGWKEARDEPLEAAKEICAEAAQSIGWKWLTATDAIARNVVRLAELEPLMRQPVEFKPVKGRARQ